MNLWGVSLLSLPFLGGGMHIRIYLFWGSYPLPPPPTHTGTFKTILRAWPNWHSQKWMMSAIAQLELISPDFLPARAQNGYLLCVYQDITDMDSSELSFMRKYHTVIQNSRIPSRPNSRSCCIHINYRYFKTLQKIYLHIIHTFKHTTQDTAKTGF